MKGSNPEDAYEQIAHVAKHRQEYKDIVSHLARLSTGNLPVRKSSVIVTTGLINRHDQQKLEKEWGIKPKIITVQKPTSTAPDLRKNL